MNKGSDTYQNLTSFVIVQKESREAEIIFTPLIIRVSFLLCCRTQTRLFLLHFLQTQFSAPSDQGQNMLGISGGN